MSAGATTFQENLLGLGRETTGGSSTAFIRDAGGFLLEQRLPSGDYYYLFDGLGSVAAMTDTAGNVAATYKYEPFGKVISSTGTVSNPWRFLGGLGVYFDGSAGLYKAGTRYYDPQLGRFTQTDPVAGGGANAYDYADQDPINNVDTDGQISRPCFSCIAGGIARGIGGQVRTTVRWAARGISFGARWAWKGGSASIRVVRDTLRITLRACRSVVCRTYMRAFRLLIPIALTVELWQGCADAIVQWWASRRKWQAAIEPGVRCGIAIGWTVFLI